MLNFIIVSELLGKDLLVCLSEAYDKNELTISKRRGIITLKSLENGSLLGLNHWRPIKLINVESDSETVRKVLPDLIHADKTGLVNGQYTGENIRLVSDVFEITKKNIRFWVF